MNAHQHRLFSAYLNGQATGEERQEVERLLRQSPQARQALEELRQLNQILSAAAPQPIKVPSQFRETIMERLQHPDSGQDSESNGDDGGQKPGPKLHHTLVAGLALTGLITLFVLWDQQKTPEQQTRGKKSENVLLAPSPALRQDQRLPGSKDGQGIAPSRIQSAASPDVQEQVADGEEPLHGSVYVRGEKGRTAISGRASKPGQENNILLPAESPSRLNLDSSAGWTAESIQRHSQAQKRTLPVAPEIILSLASQKNINPGLLLGAIWLHPGQDPKDLARDIRTQLDASFGLPESDRLQRLVKGWTIGHPEESIPWEVLLNPQTP